MIRKKRAGAAFFLGLSLSGCFQSNAPLLNSSNSDTPVQEGQYIYTDSDKRDVSVIVTQDGSITKLISTNSDGTVDIQSLRFHLLKLNFPVPDDDYYYIVMDKNNNYGLVQTRTSTVIEYDGSKFCGDLVEIAEMEHSPPSDYGVAEVTGGDTKFCKFTSLEGLSRALVTLIGRDALDPLHTYYKR